MKYEESQISKMVEKALNEALDQKENFKINKSDLKKMVKNALLEEVINYKESQIKKLDESIKKIEEDDDIPMDWQDFDVVDFKTTAKSAAQKDIEDYFGEPMQDFESDEEEEALVGDLERANLRLPSDEKELEKIKKMMNKKKAAKKSMGSFSLNEEEEGENYMAPQNLKTIKRSAEYLDDEIDAGSDIPDWVEDKISKTSDKMNSVMHYYKGKDEEDEDEMEVEAASLNEGDISTLGDSMISLDDQEQDFLQDMFKQKLAQKEANRSKSSLLFKDLDFMNESSNKRMMKLTGLLKEEYDGQHLFGDEEVDPIAAAKTSSLKDVDWEKEAIEAAGEENWNSITAKEKEELIADLKRGWHS